MTSDALMVVQFLFAAIWRLCTSWYIPGTRTTPAGFFLFCFVAVLSLNFIKRLFGLSGEIAASNRRVSAREARESRSSKKD